MQCKNNLEFLLLLLLLFSSNVDQFLKGTEIEALFVLFIFYFFFLVFIVPLKKKKQNFLITLYFKFLYHKNKIYLCCVLSTKTRKLYCKYFTSYSKQYLSR